MVPQRLLLAQPTAFCQGPAIERLQNSCIKELILLDTIPPPPEKAIPKITLLPVAPLFAEAIERIYEDKPVSTMYTF